MRKLNWIAIAGLLTGIVSQAAPSAPSKTRNIIFVMTDGLRWQEVFGGAEAALMNKGNGKVADVPALRKLYDRETATARREALMPFLWSEIARNGQIYGDREQGSDAYVTNGLNFSYPGYSETFCGFADPRIISNDKIPNPNATVFEWLNGKGAYHGKIAAFGAWDTFPFIFNRERAGFLVNAGWDPLTSIPSTPALSMINQMKVDLPHMWPDESFDALPFYTAVEYLKSRKPRILYLSLGETDDWAHDGNYKEYLDAAHRADQLVKALWDAVQSMPEYRGATTLIFSPDHGRGSGPVDWTSHGEKLPESKYIWIAFLGPDTPALGLRTHIAPVTQSQIAATLAAYLGENYPAAVPKAGKPIAEALPH